MKSAEPTSGIPSSDRAGSSRRAGLTLLELTVAFAVLILLTGGALILAARSQTHISDEVSRLALDDAASRVLERISRELIDAYPPSIQPTVLDGSQTITYQKVLGYSGGSVDLGPVNELRFELDSGETLNGADDDGDGLVDDGILVHVIAGDAVTVAAGLLSLGFTATTTGISFDVGLGGRDDAGRIVERTFTRDVSFRNSS